MVAFAPLPVRPVDESWNEIPLSTSGKAGRLLNRVVTWFPASLVMTGLAAATIYQAGLAMDGFSDFIIGLSLVVIVITTATTVRGGFVAYKIDAFNQVIEEGRSVLRETLPLRRGLMGSPVLTINQLKEDCLKNKKNEISFTGELTSLFNEKCLVENLFQSWNHVKPTDVLKDPIDRLQRVIDPVRVFSRSPGSYIELAIWLLIPVAGFAAGGIGLDSGSPHCPSSDNCKVLETLGWVNVAMSVWACIIQTPRWVRMVSDVKAQCDEMVLPMEATLNYFRRFDINHHLGESDSEVGEVKIDVLDLLLG